MTFTELDSHWRNVFRAIIPTQAGSYQLGRYNLYDRGRNNPGNQVEPYSANQNWSLNDGGKKKGPGIGKSANAANQAGASGDLVNGFGDKFEDIYTPYHYEYIPPTVSEIMDLAEHQGSLAFGGDGDNMSHCIFSCMIGKYYSGGNGSLNGLTGYLVGQLSAFGADAVEFGQLLDPSRHFSWYDMQANQFGAQAASDLYNSCFCGCARRLGLVKTCEECPKGHYTPPGWRNRSGWGGWW
jgi:hypothetical protein